MKYLNLLGYQVTDRVTGFKGVVECVSYDLYGCIQATVRPSIDEKGKIEESRWFDCKRLTETSDQPVMPAPVFPEADAVRPGIDVEEAGPAEKPAR